MKPAYEKAAKSLQGLAKVAAIDCDEDANKAFCGQMGVEGFPTLKIIRPMKTPGKPAVETYQGQRTAKAIVDAVIDKIPNHIKRVTDKTLDDWLSASNSSAKAVLFSDKGSTSALLKAVAIDFLGGISFAQIRDKENAAVEAFGITDFPALVLLPGGDEPSVVYDGDFKKDAMIKFLSQATPPNPDPAPEQPKKGKAKKKDSKKFSQFDDDSQPAEPVAADEAETKQSESAEPAQPDTPPTDEASHVLEVTSDADLHTKCFSSKSRICIIVLLPAETSDSALSEDTSKALASLSQLYSKHSKRSSSFPYYSVPSTNPKGKTIRDALSLKGEQSLEIIATNAKRGWWRKYAGKGYNQDTLETWIDIIRMNEGKRDTLPETLIGDGNAAGDSKSPTPEEAPQPEPEQEPSHPDAAEDAGDLPPPTQEASAAKQDIKDEL